MINMMYLVLTALLALNVSAEILNAFILIDDSLVKTTKNLETKNNAVYDKFEVFMQDPASAAKAKEWKERADKVKVTTDELLKFIKDKKLEIVLAAESVTKPYEENGVAGIQKKDDNNTPAEIMILKGGGKEFKDKINKHKADLTKLIQEAIKGKKAEIVQNGESIIKTLDAIFDTKDIVGNGGQVIPWESANFEHMPLAAVITIFDKFATDIRNVESDVINFCIAQVDAGTWKFNKIEAIVNSPTNYVMVGGEYKAEVFIAASDSTQAPSILVGGRRIKVENGKGMYSGGTGSPGEKSWGGVIRLQSPVTGDTVEYAFKSQYQVVVPGISVSPTKMNVFYAGVDNPVDVTASGVPAELIKVSMSGGGSIIKSGNGYIVRVKKSGGTVKVNVTADGKNLGTKVFRCKRVPDPVATIGGQSEGAMNRSKITSYGSIRATMKDFDFDLKFNITGYTILITVGGFDEMVKVKGSKFTPQVKQLIKKAKKNSRIIFEGIKAKGPDGTTRKLNNIVLKAQ